jgi:hypothetical protein
MLISKQKPDATKLVLAGPEPRFASRTSNYSAKDFTGLKYCDSKNNTKTVAVTDPAQILPIRRRWRLPHPPRAIIFFSGDTGVYLDHANHWRKINDLQSILRAISDHLEHRGTLNGPGLAPQL